MAWRESSSLLWLCLTVSSVCEGLHAQVCVSVFPSSKCSIIPQTWVQNIYLNLCFPTAEINKFSLRRVTNSCCQGISATVPRGSVIYPIEWRRKCQWIQHLIESHCISFTSEISFTKTLNSVATTGSTRERLSLHRTPVH